MPTVASLSDDLLVETLSRLPVKSLHRCMCVSRTWRGIISHPHNRRQLPQTLEGFFYLPRTVRAPVAAFTNVTGTGRPFVSPFFDFLPQHQNIFLLSCCNGLLLCRCWEQGHFHYVVCNPATEEWVRLPDSVNAGGTECMARLGFDPAVSDHFHVLEFSDDHDIRDGGMEVYSSKSGRWVHKDNGWIDTQEDEDAFVPLLGHYTGDVFLNGCLHFLTADSDIAAVDTEGKTWRNIPIPEGNTIGFIQNSQGCLHFTNFLETDDGTVLLVVYVLENYRAQEWILKHSVDASYIFGDRDIDLIQGFQWVAMHPHSNIIFLTLGWDNTLVSYDMDHQQVQEICDLGENDNPRFLPYVPFYSKLQTLHM